MYKRNIILGTVSYLTASFLVQFVSHFFINKAHYASISFMRAEPLMYFGLFTMLLQGTVLTVIYLRWVNGNSTLKQGVIFGWLTGLFFVSYPALVEADKYAVQNIAEWVMVEGSAGFFQFTFFGLLLGKLVTIKN